MRCLQTSLYFINHLHIYQCSIASLYTKFSRSCMRDNLGLKNCAEHPDKDVVFSGVNTVLRDRAYPTRRVARVLDPSDKASDFTSPKRSVAATAAYTRDILPCTDTLRYIRARICRALPSSTHVAIRTVQNDGMLVVRRSGCWMGLRQTPTSLFIYASISI